MRERRGRDLYALLNEFNQEGERLPWPIWLRVAAVWAWARLRHLIWPAPRPARRRWWFVEFGAWPAPEMTISGLLLGPPPAPLIIGAGGFDPDLRPHPARKAE